MFVCPLLHKNSLILSFKSFPLKLLTAVNIISVVNKKITLLDDMVTLDLKFCIANFIDSKIS